MSSVSESHKPTEPGAETTTAGEIAAAGAAMVTGAFDADGQAEVSQFPETAWHFVISRAELFTAMELPIVAQEELVPINALTTRSLVHLQVEVDAQLNSRIPLHVKEEAVLPRLVSPSKEIITKAPSLENTPETNLGAGGIAVVESELIEVTLFA